MGAKAVNAPRRARGAHPALGRRGGRRGPVTATLRFVARVLMLSGVLLLADAGLTLVWQEPISALLTGRQQEALADELASLPEISPGELSAAKLDRLAGRHAQATAPGDAWGRIELPALGREYVVVEGTDEGSLRKGPGHYPQTPMPGEGGTVAVAGHRTTYLAPFRTIDRLEQGDEAVVEMPWARFTYAVEDTKIVAPTDTEVINRVSHERLVLTACHPLYSAEQRIVVFAALRSVDPV